MTSEWQEIQDLWRLEVVSKVILQPCTNLLTEVEEWLVHLEYSLLNEL